MGSFVVTPSLLRTFVLGSLGLSLQACSDPAAEQPMNAPGDQVPTELGGAGGSTTVAGGAGGRAEGRAGGSKLPSVCTDPTPLLEGVDTGIFTCDGGYLHRAEARECPSSWPRADFTADEAIRSGECLRDADCDRDSFCTLVQPYLSAVQACAGIMGAPAPAPSWKCVKGCRTDADCGPAKVCVCGRDVGACVDANASDGCRTDADCHGGQCLQNARSNSSADSTFACQLAGDLCSSDKDCSASQFCAFDATGRTCMMRPPSAVCGRPFLVDGIARLASARPSATWLESGAVPHYGALSARLAEHWTRIGLMEHASIAAFARFTLQLLSLGAPMELVRDAGAAQADETRHAVMAFALASSYAGAEVGPGPIDLKGVLERDSVEQILRTTIREGCMGETFAAIEASEAARSATFPAVKSVLESIAADESEHAALAWRVVQWMLREHPALVSVARDELVRGIASEQATIDGDAEGAPDHGVLGAGRLAAVRATALREVVLPCARALLGARKFAPSRPAVALTEGPGRA